MMNLTEPIPLSEPISASCAVLGNSDRSLGLVRKGLTMTQKDELYEQYKAAWIDQHPEATHTEYEAAIRQIAKRCGV